MNQNNEHNDWIKDAPALAAMSRRNPFTVPDRYFEEGEEVVMSNIYLDHLKQKTRNQHFEVPQGYFENLTERIEGHIRLSSLPLTENTFVVPDRYFDTLQSRIAAKITAEDQTKTAKIVPLWNRHLVKYASAACFVLIASFGTYFYQNNSLSSPVAETKVSDLTNDQLLYDIDESTIIEHLEAQQSPSSNTSASDTEVENYILSHFSSSDLTHELNTSSESL